MNKKIIIPIILIIVIFVMLLFLIPKNNSKEMIDNTEINNSIKSINNTVINEGNDNAMGKNENKVEDMGTIYIKINNQILDVELEENSATKELKEKLQNGDITVQANEYGGFEKVGDLGFSLPREDVSITTVAGDIVLYQGNQISLFYNSNAWSYTRLGKIQNITANELKNILGNGDVTITLTLNMK